jgi:hypothetical protein
MNPLHDRGIVSYEYRWVGAFKHWNVAGMSYRVYEIDLRNDGSARSLVSFVNSTSSCYGELYSSSLDAHV